MSDVIDPSKLSGDRIVFGATVTVVDADTEEEIEYNIVGDYEADIKLNRLAISAPLARAMIGKEPGDTFELKRNGKTREFEVSDVRFEKAD